MLTLQLHTLCEFANAIPSSINLIEGQKVVNSGMIIMIDATSKSNESIELFALCLQTSALTSEPHTITGTLKINNSNNNYSDEKNVVTIDRMSCSCKAGTSQSCKHIVGVLLHCSR